MARMLGVFALLAAGAAAWAAMFAHGSEAAPAVEIQRTFVSTSGSDANPCTRAAPCRSFQAAIANTLPGGEVVALDSGGYGPFTVGKSVTVAGAPGAHVAISAFVGDGIHVNAGTTDTVVLKNLHLTGLGADAGIVFQSAGTLVVAGVVVSGFEFQCLVGGPAGSALVIRDSEFNGCNAGVVVNNNVRVTIERSRADGNESSGFFFAGARGSISDSSASRNAGLGFDLQSSVFAITDSVAEGNTNGVGVSAEGAAVTLTRVVLANNEFSGLVTFIATPVVRIGGSTVTGNGTGLRREAGTLETFQDNLVRGNTFETFGTITTVSKT